MDEPPVAGRMLDARWLLASQGKFWSTTTFGSVSLTSGGGGDGFVAKISTATLTVGWAKAFSGTSEDEAVAVVATADAVYVGGRSAAVLLIATGSTTTRLSARDRPPDWVMAAPPGRFVCGRRHDDRRGVQDAEQQQDNYRGLLRGQAGGDGRRSRVGHQVRSRGGQTGRGGQEAARRRGRSAGECLYMEVAGLCVVGARSLSA